MMSMDEQELNAIPQVFPTKPVTIGQVVDALGLDEYDLDPEDGQCIGAVVILQYEVHADDVRGRERVDWFSSPSLYKSQRIGLVAMTHEDMLDSQRSCTQ